MSKTFIFKYYIFNCFSNELIDILYTSDAYKQDKLGSVFGSHFI